jgi:hypothetical protein
MSVRQPSTQRDDKEPRWATNSLYNKGGRDLFREALASTTLVTAVAVGCAVGANALLPHLSARVHHLIFERYTGASTFAGTLEQATSLHMSCLLYSLSVPARCMPQDFCACVATRFACICTVSIHWSWHQI